MEKETHMQKSRLKWLLPAIVVMVLMTVTVAGWQNNKRVKDNDLRNASKSMKAVAAKSARILFIYPKKKEKSCVKASIKAVTSSINRVRG